MWRMELDRKRVMLAGCALALHLPGVSKMLEFDLAMKSNDLKRALQCLLTMTNSSPRNCKICIAVIRLRQCFYGEGVAAWQDTGRLDIKMDDQHHSKGCSTWKECLFDVFFCIKQLP